MVNGGRRGDSSGFHSGGCLSVQADKCPVLQEVPGLSGSAGSLLSISLAFCVSAELVAARSRHGGAQLPGWTGCLKESTAWALKAVTSTLLPPSFCSHQTKAEPGLVLGLTIGTAMPPGRGPGGDGGRRTWGRN